ncbi:hypothetical protein NCCP2222_23600 [Sporosarcina sp. NCCP-2222]|uniref:DUF418 domain-containing protein n=1 Tax=Sporosarcina sp. NCCP-2222 TaxID=2935073 RepID=UPI002089A707|nr:DUF418 domain-containing protein [Sporosarcina sp. NCCP-2222]GKV56413.1 hypothetical protein NCCP2222_23600 [Sporosarcina sp. NCCP-2222]
MKRINVLDALRGFALLGILLVNIRFFNESQLAISYGGLPVEGWLNKTIETLSTLLVDGKFMLLFSFFFGYGAVILHRNAEAAGKKFTWMFVKRMLALLIFGILHVVFLWYGDILAIYALVGLVFILFVKRSPKTLLTLSSVFSLLIPVLMSVAMLLGNLAGTEGMDDLYTIDPMEIQMFQQKDQQIYGEGTYMDITRKRIGDYQMSFFNMVLFFPQILGTFLLGAYFGKRKLLEDIPSKKQFMVRLGWIGAVAGFALTVPRILLDSSNNLLDIFSIFIGAPLQMLAYVACFSLLYNRHPKWLQLFSYPGKMAFSMYILQSVLCGFIFYSYGLGLFGTMGLWQTTAIAFLLFGLQIAISALWLRRFRTGPLEYVWRVLYKGRVGARMNFQREM